MSIPTASFTFRLVSVLTFFAQICDYLTHLVNLMKLKSNSVKSDNIKCVSRLWHNVTTHIGLFYTQCGWGFKSRHQKMPFDYANL